jgi:predicted dehydrogenase
MLCSAKGLTAATAGEKWGFESVTTDEDELINDPGVRVVFVLTRHDQHARQVVKSLRAGKQVFVEKPLALTVEEVVAIEAALTAAGAARPVLAVGFNRRFSPAARQVKEFFNDARAPRTISVRFSAGAVPPDHWTQDDESGGGRLIGEACHALDLAAYLAGAPPVRVFAESVGGPHAPAVSDDQAFITVRHANGSVSSIAYLAGGDRAFPKERIEVLGGGRVALIEDYRLVATYADGRRKATRYARQDKGHRAEIQAFAAALARAEPAPIPWEELRAVSLAGILAVRSLREGVPFDIP